MTCPVFEIWTASDPTRSENSGDCPLTNTVRAGGQHSGASAGLHVLSPEAGCPLRGL